MDLSVIVSLIVAVTGLIGAVWGIVKYYDQKRTKEQQAKATAEALEKKKQFEFFETIQTHLQNNEEIIKAQQADIASLRSDVTIIKNQIVEVQHQAEDTQHMIDENEIDRLRSYIIEGMNKIENGLIMTEADFTHLHHSYDKYKEHNGNSYIDGCMDTIRDYEKACRECESDYDDNDS